MPDSVPVLTLTPGIAPSVPQEASLLARAQSLTSASTPDKIKRSAQDFEAILLSQWLEQAREAFAGVPGGDEDNDDPGQSQMLGLGMQALASAVSKSGGVGIARMIEHYLDKQSGIPAAPIGKK